MGSISVTYNPLFHQLPRRAQGAVHRALVGRGERVYQRAVDLAPKRTGALARSINLVAGPFPSRMVRIEAGGGAVGYAQFQEFGTRSIRPRLFMTRAFNEHQNGFGSDLARELRAAFGG